MYRSLLVLALVCSSIFSFAQQDSSNSTIKITVLNETGAGVDNATAELLRSTDSVLIRSAIADKNGLAFFEKIPAGTYLLRVSALNYATAFTAPFSATATQANLVIPTLTLTPKGATQLSGVTVTARKPFIQKLSDRIVVNVENSIVNAGSTALEVLERSPGITLNQNEVISLRGRSGVVIMIDGKPTPMSGADLTNYLRGLPSNAIERIDIITNPSAKYDAAGNSGIIDIRMKRDQRLGYNGTLTSTLR